MCFSAPMSIAAFIIGTIFNIIGLLYFKDKTYTALVILWQWVLCMQIVDYFAWIGKGCETKTSKYAARAAYLLNVTQPIILFICFIFISPVNICMKLAASIIVTVYIMYILYASRNITGKECIYPENDKCKHINYYYWNTLNPLVYIVALVSIAMLLIRPTGLMLFSVIYILLTLFLSTHMYPCGSPGSIWCMFIVSITILNIFVYNKVR